MIPVIITADRKTLELILNDLKCRYGDFEEDMPFLCTDIFSVVKQIEKQLKDSDLVCPIQKLRE